MINQPGAGGAIAARAAATRDADGYTLGTLAFSAFATLPGSADNLPVQGAARFPAHRLSRRRADVITAAPWLEAKTLPDLIALAKTRPGELAYGTNGRGRLTHLTGELLASRAGIKLQMVPYSGGTAQVLNDVMGKRIPLLFEAYSGIAGAITAGNVRPARGRGAQTRRRIPRPADRRPKRCPASRPAAGLVLLAPAGTPDTIVKKINADLIKALDLPETAKRIAAIGWDRRPLTPAETLAFIHGEQQKWAPILRLIAEAH